MRKPENRPARRKPAPAPQPEFDPAFLAQMRQLALKMNVLEAQGEALGLAPHLRELLRCPKCGLQEDALTGGALAVYFDGQPAIDSGLRFERLTNKKFLCPSCGAQVKEPPFEIPPDAFNP